VVPSGKTRQAKAGRRARTKGGRPQRRVGLRRGPIPPLSRRLTLRHRRTERSVAASTLVLAAIVAGERVTSIPDELPLCMKKMFLLAVLAVLGAVAVRKLRVE